MAPAWVSHGPGRVQGSPEPIRHCQNPFQAFWHATGASAIFPVGVIARVVQVYSMQSSTVESVLQWS
jgi:hypothetical protein